MSSTTSNPPLNTKELEPSSASVSTAQHDAESKSHQDNNDAVVDKPSSDTPPASNGVDPAEARYKPSSPAFWLIITSAYISFFLVALDRTIIATAIPSITNTFNSIEDIGWYGSAYMLTCAILNPLFGRIYQLYDTKWTFLVSIFIFEVGSALCGAAPNSIALILGRAIAGIGAAGIGSGAIMITVFLIPLRKRPIFSSFFGVAFGLSSVLGPLVGGSFTDSRHLTWRWCFYINLPIGAVAFFNALIFLKLPSAPKEKLTVITQIKRLDPIGLVFFVPSMVCLILALQWGGTTYSWSAPKVIGLLVTFAVTFLAFLAVEWKFPDTAIAPPRVVANRSIIGSMLFTFLLGGGMMNVAYYISIWFQAAEGTSAMQAGIRTLPMVLPLVVFGIVSAIVTQKIGYYVPAMLLSPVLSSIAAGLLSTLTPSVGKGKWIGYEFLYGIGLGVGSQSANIAAQTVLERKDISIGTALMFFMQQLGGSIFLAVGQNVFSSQLVKELSGNAGLDTQAIIRTGATDLRKVLPANEINIVVDAYSYSLTRTFVLTAALNGAMILGSLMLEWRSIKKAPGKNQNNAAVDVEKNGSQPEK